ncbi:MAG: hypothetical protein OJF51_001356 [Nitrospira sp.]|nr:MAG: hypothetical protein OJF51_001356 [Nitrospira sp.]
MPTTALARSEFRIARRESFLPGFSSLSKSSGCTLDQCRYPEMFLSKSPRRPCRLSTYSGVLYESRTDNDPADKSRRPGNTLEPLLLRPARLFGQTTKDGVRATTSRKMIRWTRMPSLGEQSMGMAT